MPKDDNLRTKWQVVESELWTMNVRYLASRGMVTTDDLFKVIKRRRKVRGER